MNIKNNKILITGGASGIGLGLTKRFLEEGNTLIICGRRQEVMDEVIAQYPDVIGRRCDVSNEKDRVALFEWIKEEHNDTNVLINNAGIQNWMGINDEDYFEKAKNEIAINVEAPIHLSDLFSKLPNLKVIMNVTSGLSFSPLTKTPVYSATKAFFHSYTLSLRHLMKEQGIEVIEIIPPAINTDLGGKGLHDYAPPVSEFIASIFAQLEEGKQELTFGFSEQISKAGPEELKAAFARMNP